MSPFHNMFAPTKYSKPKTGRLMVSGSSSRGNTFGVISKRHTALSSDLKLYQGFTSHGGLNVNHIDFARRNHGTSEPSYSLDGYYDMILPNEFLVNQQSAAVGTDAQIPDTKVGTDYYNAPRDLVEGLRRARTQAQAVDNTIFMKVNNAKHTFIFTNYSRFPKMVHIEHLIGPVTDIWNPDNPTISVTTRSNFDFAATEAYPDQFSNIETIYIPGTLESQNAGAKVSHEIYCPLNKLFGPEYSDVPATPDFEYPSNGGWICIEPIYALDGVGDKTVIQSFYKSDPGESSVSNSFSYKIRMHVTTIEPHGELVQGDGGVWSADASPPGDLPLTFGSNSLQSKGLNIEVMSRWDCTFKFTGEVEAPRHYGDEAREGDIVA